MRGVLLSFHPLRLSWSAPAELGNLISAEWSGGLPPLAGRGLMCGFYVNELVLRLLPRDDPHEALSIPMGNFIPPGRRRAFCFRTSGIRKAVAGRARLCSAAGPRRGERRAHRP